MGFGTEPGGGGYGVEIFREAAEADGARMAVAKGDEEGGYGVWWVMMIWGGGGGAGKWWMERGVEGGR